MYTPLNINYRQGDIYTKLINAMNEWVWIWDKDERTVYANPKFCQMIGYRLEDIIGKESYEFWDKESAERVRTVNLNDRKQWKSSSYEGNLVTRKKTKIPVLLSGAPLPDGGTIGIMTDVTEIKKWAQTEKILTQALEHAEDGIILLNAKWEILTWNHGAKKIFGYKKEEVEKKNITFFFPDIEERSFQNLSGDDFMRLELIAHHKTDGERMVQISIMHIFQSEEWHDPCNLCLVRDITIMKRSEVELTSRYQKIKDAYEWLGKVQRQNDYLNDLISLTTKEYDKKQIIPSILHAIIMLSGGTACELRFYDEASDSLMLEGHFGFTMNLKWFKSIPFSDSWAEHSYKLDAPYYKMDFHEDKAIPLVKHFVQEKLQSAITIWFRGKHKPIWSITILSSEGNVFDLYENTFLHKYLKLVEVTLNALR